MFEVDVKNVTEWRGGGGDQLGFGVLILCTVQYMAVLYNIWKSCVQYNILLYFTIYENLVYSTI